MLRQVHDDGVDGTHVHTRPTDIIQMNGVVSDKHEGDDAIAINFIFYHRRQHVQGLWNGNYGVQRGDRDIDNVTHDVRRRESTVILMNIIN